MRRTQRLVARLVALGGAALAVLPVMGLTAQAAGAPGTGAPTIKQHIGIPAYFPPSISYNPDEPWGPTYTGEPPVATGSYRTFDTAGGFVIANVVNGPDYISDVNYDYSGTLAAEHNAGNKVIGYVDTGYFGTTGLRTRAGSIDIESWRDQIEQDIDAWYAFYGASMDGIFFDQGQNSCGPSNLYANVYAQISQYLKDAHQGAFSVINPGITVPSCFENSADTIITFEGPESSYTASTVALDWTPVDPNKIMHIVYGVPAANLATVVAKSKSWGAGYIYITDEGGTGNPPLYKQLPTYLAAEIAAAASSNDAKAPSAPKGVDTYDVQFTTAQLSWESSSDNRNGSGVKAYDVYIKQDTGDYYWVASSTRANSDVPDISLTGLTPGATYQAYVGARDGSGNVSAPSKSVSWTQDADTDADDLAAPTSPVASATTYSTTQLSWQAPSGGQAGQDGIVFYEVYEDGRRILQLPPDALRATVTGMAPGTSHSFVIYAINGAGKVSPASPPVSVTTLSFTGTSVASTGNESYTMGNLTLSLRAYLPFSFIRAFIDVDNDPNTGYSYNGIGADYMIENGRLFTLRTGGTFTPTLVGNAPATVADYVNTWTISKDRLTGAGTTFQVIYQAEGFAPAVHTSPITITES